MDPNAKRARFERLYDEHVDRVLAYCRRHLDASAAEDVVADTFTVAWRRLDDVPDDAIGWLIVTARHHLWAGWRRLRRRDAAFASVARELAHAPSAEVSAVRRAELLDTLRVLPVKDREAILLVAWDGLSHEQAASVLGCSPGALRVRVHRARARLATHRAEEGHHHE